MRIGICGGTYDPLHLGHIALVRAALNSGLVDEVYVVPSGLPPHKRKELVSMATYRFEMASCAFADEKRVRILDLEILREGPSYTLDTARMLQDKYPDEAFFLIYGSDILRDIERWHQPAALLAEWPLLLANRGGVADDASRKLAQQLREKLGARIQFFDAPSIDLSATRIRKLATVGQPIDDYVLPEVARFIKKHALYRWNDELIEVDQGLWVELHLMEQRLWPLLKRKRLLHSLNVMLYALHLARRHQVDLRQVALAAILHDCAKCLPLKEQLVLAARRGDKALLAKELAHAPAGAMLAAEKFNINDPLILQAIHCHTTGCADMNRLDQILFVADKVEPARTYANLDTIRLFAEDDLDQATRICLQEINQYLQKSSKPVHPYARQALTDMDTRIAARK